MPDKNPHLGSTLESLLRNDDTYEDAKNDAVKSVLAYKLEQAMQAQKLSKARMAEPYGNQPLATRPIARSGERGCHAAYAQARRGCRGDANRARTALLDQAVGSGSVRGESAEVCWIPIRIDAAGVDQQLGGGEVALHRGQQVRPCQLHLSSATIIDGINAILGRAD